MLAESSCARKKLALPSTTRMSPSVVVICSDKVVRMFLWKAGCMPGRESFKTVREPSAKRMSLAAGSVA